MEQYLFHQRRSIQPNQETSKTFHRHDFWQVDFINIGSGQLQCKRNNQVVHTPFVAGDTIIIPPGIEHCFAYDDKCCNSWLSVKFTSASEVPSASILVGDKILEHAFAIINEALLPHFMGHMVSMNVVNAALSVVIGRFLLEQQTVHTSEFIRQIREFVYSRQGYRISVSDIGDVMKCTGKHAALRFKQETGESLKNFLDRCRADFAARLLRTSSKSLKEIAYQLGFRDVYAFSRFFKRTMHENLSGFRAKKPESR